MIHNGYDSDYETLLKIKGTSTMQIKRTTQLAIEIFKTAKTAGPFVIVFSLWKLLTSIAGSSVSDFVVVLNTSLIATF